jgi:D-3-phosphoglycerate dehydrogenase
MSRPKILIVSKSFGVHCREAVEKLNGFADVETKQITSPDQMREAINSYDGIVLGNEKADGNLLMHAIRLKIIAKHGVGVDNIDLNAATKKGIVVTYTPHANSDSVAEYTIAHILNVMKSIPKAHLGVLNGGWNRFLGFELMGKTVGIVGFGAVGKRVAKKLQGFDVKIMAYDPFVKDEEFRKAGVMASDLESLLRVSDVVTLHVALTSETRHLMNMDRLKLMKKESYLVNMSRGAIIDEKALCEVLKEKRIAGAALDVFEQEPVSKDSPLLNLDNVVLTPHNANFTLESLRRTDMMNAIDLERCFRGEKPVNIANP